MHDLFQNILKEHNLSDCHVIAAVAVLTNDGRSDFALSLPAEYHVSQQKHWCDVVCDVDNFLISSLWWLSNGGFIEYEPEFEAWTYHPPVPAMPNFPNDLTIGCLTNPITDEFCGINKTTRLERHDGSYPGKFRI